MAQSNPCATKSCYSVPRIFELCTSKPFHQPLDDGSSSRFLFPLTLCLVMYGWLESPDPKVPLTGVLFTSSPSEMSPSGIPAFSSTCDTHSFVDRSQSRAADGKLLRFCFLLVKNTIPDRHIRTISNWNIKRQFYFQFHFNIHVKVKIHKATSTRGVFHQDVRTSSLYVQFSCTNATREVWRNTVQHTATRAQRNL